MVAATQSDFTYVVPLDFIAVRLASIIGGMYGHAHARCLRQEFGHASKNRLLLRRQSANTWRIRWICHCDHGHAENEYPRDPPAQVEQPSATFQLSLHVLAPSITWTRRRRRSVFSLTLLAERVDWRSRPADGDWE